MNKQASHISTFLSVVLGRSLTVHWSMEANKLSGQRSCSQAFV
ncbi:hypothetical protein LEMLEM_LOCUS15077 [Lemmus lemmus]